ncbi:cytochrome c3 family protein [Desulfatibacillum aliphaticivorans]|uniref:cytochrome c3 family protein n=1 Tax=Desulfatibacillum aliphaticivorans TaxID=218208 RepID=UPI00040C3A25|nr:cytochrome c3 family protein [Desulfatibacillum aliphaticivorans]
MKTGKLFKILMLASVATLFLAAGLIASTCPDIIPMENAAYDSHKKGIVQFTHGKHYKDHAIACGECHHDAQGKPLADLKEGDAVQGCIECHKIAGEMPREVKQEIKGLSREEKQKKELEYHAEALHMNCRDCHKAYNKEKGFRGKDGAPTSCTACHPK